MADLTGKPISELTEATSVSDSDLFAIASGGASKKISAATLSHELPDIKMYTSVTHLGLSSGTTIAAVYAAMPNGSMAFLGADGFASGEVPNQYGYVRICRASWVTRGSIEFFNQVDTDADYRMYLTSAGVPTGTWVRRYKPSYVEATASSATWSSSVASSPAASVTVTRAGNVAYIRGSFTFNTSTTWNTVTLATGLASNVRPGIAQSVNLIVYGYTGDPMTVSVNTDGSLTVYVRGTSVDSKGAAFYGTYIIQ